MRSKNNNHSSAAPARHAPPAAAPPRAAPPPAAPHPPATQQHNNHSAHPAPHQQAPPTFVQQGPGFMGTLAATAAGSVAGNAIGNMLFGGRSHEGVQESGAGAVASAPTAVNPCAPHINQFIQCVESSANDVTACQWSWNNVAECRRSFPQLF